MTSTRTSTACSYRSVTDRGRDELAAFLADPAAYHRAAFGALVMKDPEDPDPKDDPKDPPAYTPPATQADLDRILEQRLARERSKYADHDALKAKAEKYDELEQAQKTDAQKAAERQAELERTASENGLTAMRLEVALDKGLTALQAKRLVGKTKDELAADADQLLEDFKAARPAGPTGKPTERLRRVADPDDDDGPEETDPAKLAAGIRLR